MLLDFDNLRITEQWVVMLEKTKDIIIEHKLLIKLIN